MRNRKWDRGKGGEQITIVLGQEKSKKGVGGKDYVDLGHKQGGERFKEGVIVFRCVVNSSSARNFSLEKATRFRNPSLAVGDRKRGEKVFNQSAREAG